MSGQPTPAHQQALAYRDRQLQRGKLAVLLSIAGAITILVAGWSAVDDPTPGALLAALAGLIALAAGVLLTTRVYATVRYRIARPYAGLWLTAKIVGALGVFVASATVADSVGVPSVPRRVLAVLLVAGIGWVVTDHGVRSTLFQADATGVRFGRTVVPWPVIGQLVVAPGAWPGTAEIGALPMPGGQFPPTRPVPGAVLADLPVHTVVPASKLEWGRLNWAITQSGRADIQLVPRGATNGPQPVLGHPAGFSRQPTMHDGKRQAWLVAGGIGLTVVLVAGTVAVLLNDAVAGTTAIPGTPLAVAYGATPATSESAPAPLPATATEAAAAETTGPLMARVRAADPCELLNRDFPLRFGSSVAEELRQSQNFDECQLVASTAQPTAPRTRFRIELVEYLAAKERAELLVDEINGREVFRDKESPTSNGCSYFLPYGSTGFGAQVFVLRFVAGKGSDQLPWPEACATAKEYAALVAPSVEKLPQRTRPLPEPTLAGKDPCEVGDALMSRLRGQRQGPITRYNPMTCSFDVTHDQGVYKIDLTFDRDAEQIGGVPVSVGGLNGIKFADGEKDTVLCSLSLVYVPATGRDAWDAHNISVSVQRGPPGTGKGSFDTCEPAMTAATLLIAYVRAGR